MRPSFTSSVLPPHERGQELGRHFASEIDATVRRYRNLFARVAEHPFDVDEWSGRAWSTIQRVAPAHAEEIAGIAAGAGLSPSQVASVNARTELLAAANPSGLVTECSSVVSLPPDGRPVAVQTWDWYDSMTEGWFTWTIPFPDGRRLRTVTEFGMLAKIGVNDRGVGVMLNMLRHRADAQAYDEQRIGHPVHLLARAILDDASSVSDAREITRAPTSASTSLTVVDGQGRAASVELFPGGPGIVEPTDGLLVRTNHFVSDAGADGDLAATISPSTQVRRDHLLELLGAGAPPTTTGEIVEAMTHHHEAGGVCRHPLTETDPALWHRTLATVGIDVLAGTLDVRDGGPCGRRMMPVEKAAEQPVEQPV